MSLALVVRSLRPPTIHLGAAASPRFMFHGSKCLLFSSNTSSNGISESNSHPEEEEERYSKSYRLDGVGRGSKVEIRTNTGHNLSTDVPKKMGGGDTAPQPVETLLAAWMGCTQATALFVGRQMSPRRILIDSLEFQDIEAFRDERGALSLPIEETPTIPSRIHRITGVIRVVVSTRNKGPLSADQLELLKEQTEIRCPVANMMIASGCSMEVEWVDATAVIE
jgi:putative redox protein